MRGRAGMLSVPEESHETVTSVVVFAAKRAARLRETDKIHVAKSGSYHCALPTDQAS